MLWRLKAGIMHTYTYEKPQCVNAFHAEVEGQLQQVEIVHCTTIN